MPNPHRPGPRFELSEDALDYLIERDPRFRRNFNGDANVTRIATIGGSATPSTLRKIVRGDLPISLEAVAGMVKASGAITDDEVWSAVRRLLVYVPERGECESAEAAA